MKCKFCSILILLLMVSTLCFADGPHTGVDHFTAIILNKSGIDMKTYSTNEWRHFDYLETVEYHREGSNVSIDGYSLSNYQKAEDSLSEKENLLIGFNDGSGILKSNSILYDDYEMTTPALKVLKDTEVQIYNINVNLKLDNGDRQIFETEKLFAKINDKLGYFINKKDIKEIESYESGMKDANNRLKIISNTTLYKDEELSAPLSEIRDNTDIQEICLKPNERGNNTQKYIYNPNLSNDKLFVKVNGMYGYIESKFVFEEYSADYLGYVFQDTIAYSDTECKQESSLIPKGEYKFMLIKRYIVNTDTNTDNNTNVLCYQKNGMEKKFIPLDNIFSPLKISNPYAKFENNLHGSSDKSEKYIILLNRDIQLYSDKDLKNKCDIMKSGKKIYTEDLYGVNSIIWGYLHSIDIMKESKVLYIKSLNAYLDYTKLYSNYRIIDINDYIVSALSGEKSNIDNLDIQDQKNIANVDGINKKRAVIDYIIVFLFIILLISMCVIFYIKKKR